MTAKTYTRQDREQSRESWELEERKALQRYLANRKLKTGRRSLGPNQLILAQEYLQTPETNLIVLLKEYREYQRGA